MMNASIRCAAAVWAAMTMEIFTIAGEPIEGTVTMKMDISGKFIRETPGQWYAAWRERVMKRFKRFAPQLDTVYTFMRTDIPISAGGKMVRGGVYQCVEKPEAFFFPAEFTRIHFKKREVSAAWRDQLAVSPDRSVIMIERFGPSLEYANYRFDGRVVEWKGDGNFTWSGWCEDVMK